MSAALPPVTDCGCTASTATAPTATSCCFMVGLLDPNISGAVPPLTTVWYEYRQLADLVNGPVTQLWYWNPWLSVWQ